ncbi:MAG: Na+/H+ antiporter subunit E [Candidatus Thermoplasmatota archaeon]|nr:Na+/H+ antiporter subunit E [Candidatus Thermoplasmatota archaeon]
MFTFLVTFLGVLVLYLLLVWGSGDAGSAYWAIEEVLAGFVLALISAGIARAILGKAENSRMFLKWPLFLIYVPTVFLWNLAKANVDVAYRVITGRINPGIVRIRPGLKTDLGRTILANSITLTPGTLTIDIDRKTGDLFVHWINVRDTKTDEEKTRAVCGSFPEWARRLSE